MPTAAAALPENALIREDVGAVAHLRLSRPAARNSLTLAAMAEIEAALGALAGDPSIRVVVLSAEGPAFCAGHDLKELTARRADPDHGAAFFARTFDQCSRLMLAIADLPQPVIAAVETVATAAGCQLVASCDLAVAGAQARFCTPGVNIGLFCSTPMVAVTRTVGPKHAMEMLLTGDMFDAAQAWRFGLINQVTAPGEAFAGAFALAEKIAAKSRAAIAIGKKAFYAQQNLSAAQAYGLASRIMAENLLKADASEGIGAFLARRAPVWPE